MRPQDALDCLIRPGLRLMGEPFDRDEAAFLLLVIGFYESGFRARYQVDGPARGFWQFEQIGLLQALKPYDVRRVLRQLILPEQPERLWPILPALDLGAVVLARGLLWSHPEPLPSIHASSQDLHRYYRETWRPGKAPVGRFDYAVTIARAVVEYETERTGLADI
ncbi:MAG: hypothetical protein KDH19_19990 [Geminicoccaceae bacterium]|nr:hypothetical protein [Geminicoccaceae bacterium]